MGAQRIVLRRAAEAGAAEWDAAWRRARDGTFFQSRQWAELWQCHTSGRLVPSARLLTFSDGLRVVLPMMAEPRGLGLLRHYLASPAGTVGGWLAEGPLGDAHARAMVRYLEERIGDVTWRASPLQPSLPWQKAVVTEESTHLLDLTAGARAVWAAVSSSHRRAADKAVREGVVVRRGQCLEDWHGYYRAYEDSVRRWGTRASGMYEWSLFLEMFRRQSERIQLWVATVDHEVVAGAIGLYAPTHVAYWHGAAVQHHLPRRPVQLLFREMIRDACDRSIHWFDFNPSARLPGVVTFKERFGAEARSSPLVEIRSRRAIVIGWLARLRQTWGYR